MKNEQTTISKFVLAISILLCVFSSCSNDEKDIPSINTSRLKDVVTEQQISKAQIIAKLDAMLPDANIGSSPIAFFIGDINVASITYKTTGVDGNPTIASGIIAIPTGTTTYNHLLSIQHGTLDMEEAPSKQLFYYEMIPVIGRSIVVIADYLGYGISQTSDRQHPYLHLKSTGIVCADMIDAAREYLHNKGITENGDKIDLMGYSQGGVSTLATLIELESRGKTSQVRKVHAGGGSYDIVETLQSSIESAISNYPRTGYIPYIIRGMECGEQLTLDPNKIYAPSFIQKGNTEIFTSTPLSEWHNLIGSNIEELLHPDFFAAPAFNGNVEIIKLNEALSKNSIIRHNTPQTAVTLYHSPTDDFVPYSNSKALKSKWGNATLVDLESSGHASGNIEFLLRVMGYWEILKPYFPDNSSK